MKLKPFIERIITEIGPRPAGSEAEFAAGRVFADELKKRGAVVSTQDAKVCPGIITGLMNLMTGTYLIAIILYFPVPVASALIVAILLVMFLLSRQLGNGVIDWLFKKATTRNVIGRYKPKGTAKAALIFSGHHDSPDMMPLLGLKTKRYVHLIENGVVLGLALMIPAGILRAVFSGPVLSCRGMTPSF
jgi:hypothetical protein